MHLLAHRIKDMMAALPRRVALVRWLSTEREKAGSSIWRETHVASVAVSSLLSAMESLTPATDVQAYSQSESQNLRSVTDQMAASRVRPSPLTGVTAATFGFAGVLLGAVPPRIRHACIGGLYEALGSMHTDHLRELLEQGKEHTSDGTDTQLSLIKHLRDTHLGSPEGSPPSGQATDLLLRALMNKGEPLKVDAASVAAASTGELLAALIRASRVL
mmetsp:Transcript_11415/g.31878  ORF Transcript_11415/g.31878 Transcript_11415/m.31878 type:complete len:217 (-) Transcript_11415:1662-2312(-)